MGHHGEAELVVDALARRSERLAPRARRAEDEVLGLEPIVKELRVHRPEFGWIGDGHDLHVPSVVGLNLTPASAPLSTNDELVGRVGVSPSGQRALPATLPEVGVPYAKLP
eukprot:2786464-Prymnesium_polylepis.1